METESMKHIKEKLLNARTRGPEAIQSVQSVERELEPIQTADAELVTELFLSYRAVKAWNHMISLVERMSPMLSAKPALKTQLALALHRAGRSEEAVHILLELIESEPLNEKCKFDSVSETYGILGSVFKDEWMAAQQAGDTLRAQGLINKAIDAYLKAFEADWRDAYSGLNAVTLMELREPPDERRKKLIPMVTYAIERRMARGKPDYWDWSTLLEIAILANDESAAKAALANAMAGMREKWEPETTLHNLQMIRLARARRGKILPWALTMEEALWERAR